MAGNDWVTAYFDEIRYETDEAVLFTFDGGDTEEWIPRSQIDEIDDKAGELTLRRWIAEKRGIDHE